MWARSASASVFTLLLTIEGWRRSVDSSKPLAPRPTAIRIRSGMSSVTRSATITLRL